MAQNNQDNFNEKAVEYLSGHARNVVNSMVGRPVDPVRPWFGDGGLRSEAVQPQATGRPNSPARQQLASPTPAATQQQRAAVTGPVVLRNPGQPAVAPPNTSPANPVTRLASGIDYQPMADGSKVYTMGTPGQDGYGKVTLTGNLPSPGSTLLNKGVPESPNSIPSNVDRLAKLGNTRGTTRGDGFEFQGTAADAAKFFQKPLGGIRPGEPGYNEFRAMNYQKANPFDQNNPFDDRFSYKPPQGSDMPLIPPPPKIMNSSGGWKGEIAANNANAAAYGDYIRALTSATGNSKQEQGEMYRAQLQDKRAREAHDLALKQLESSLAFDKARIDTETLNQQKGQVELGRMKMADDLNAQFMAEQDPTKAKALGNKILTMNRKDPKTWQIATREEPVDPTDPTAGMRKVPYAVNLADPTQVIELGGQGGQQPTPAPQAALDYLKKNPGQASAFKQKYGYLPPGT